MTFSSRSAAALAVIAALTNAETIGHNTAIVDNEESSVRLLITSTMHKHKIQLQKLAKQMDMNKAVEIVRSQGNASTALLNLVQSDGARQGRRLRHTKGSKQLDLVTTDKDKKDDDENAVLKAVNMLNEMIYKVQEAYDQELTKCCAYDKTQTALMEEARQGIAADNQRAADARKEMLSASASIMVCEKEIPILKDTLEELIATCRDELKTLDGNIEIISSDVAEMTKILKLVECSTDDTTTKAPGASLIMYTCDDGCGGTYTTWKGADKLPDRTQALALKLFAEEPAKETTGTTTTLPDVTTIAPRTVKRNRPCKAATTMDPNSNKCTISRSPVCPKIQEKFEGIMTEFIETQRDLEEKRTILADECKEQRANLEAQIASYEVKLKQYNTALAAATAVNAEALESSRLKSKQLVELVAGYKDMTEECHTNYDAMEAEECALTKIRGEVVTKIKSGGDLPIYQDCVVSDWVEATECTVSCGGGTLEMARSVRTYPFRGADCPKLKEIASCNLHKCPIDCKLADWNGWSSCSAECGGGVSERNRYVTQEALHGGEDCGETQEVVSCNAQSCDKDCVLADWTAWSNCSKPCDLGHRSRFMVVLEKPVGGGKCLSEEERNQQVVCNVQACPVVPMTCTVKTDLVLVIDGSGSIGSHGWEKSIDGAKKIVSAMDLEETGSKVALMVYSGPKTYCQYYQCVGYANSWWFKYYCGAPAKNPYCGVDELSHFSGDTTALTDKLDAATFPARGTYTTHALYAAKTELGLGQADATSTVVVMTDGHPADRHGTATASNEVKKLARLVYVPVTKYAPLQDIKTWATNEDAVVAVDNFDDLDKQEMINRITASSCAEVATKSE